MLKYSILKENLGLTLSNEENKIELKSESLLKFSEYKEVACETHLFILISNFVSLLFPLKPYEDLCHLMVKTDQVRNQKQFLELDKNKICYDSHLSRPEFVTNLSNFISFSSGFALYLNANESVSKQMSDKWPAEQLLAKYKLPLAKEIPKEFEILRDLMAAGINDTTTFYIQYQILPFFMNRRFQLNMIVYFHLSFMYSENLNNKNKKADFINFISLIIDHKNTPPPHRHSKQNLI